MAKGVVIDSPVEPDNIGCCKVSIIHEYILAGSEIMYIVENTYCIFSRGMVKSAPPDENNSHLALL